MHRFNVVADGHHSESEGPWNGSGSVAGGRRVSVAKQFRSHQKKLRGIEGVARPAQPLIAMEVCHVVRRQEHRVVAGRVQVTEGPIFDANLWKGHPALGLEVRDDEFVALEGLRLSAGGILRDQNLWNEQ